MGASSGDLRQTLGNRAVNRTQVSRTTAERKGVIMTTMALFRLNAGG